MSDEFPAIIKYAIIATIICGIITSFLPKLIVLYIGRRLRNYIPVNIRLKAIGLFWADGIVLDFYGGETLHIEYAYFTCSWFNSNARSPISLVVFNARFETTLEGLLLLSHNFNNTLRNRRNEKRHSTCAGLSLPQKHGGREGEENAWKSYYSSSSNWEQHSSRTSPLFTSRMLQLLQFISIHIHDIHFRVRAFTNRKGNESAYVDRSNRHELGSLFAIRRTNHEMAWQVDECAHLTLNASDLHFCFNVDTKQTIHTRIQCDLLSGRIYNNASFVVPPNDNYFTSINHIFCSVHSNPSHLQQWMEHVKILASFRCSLAIELSLPTQLSFPTVIHNQGMGMITNTSYPFFDEGVRMEGTLQPRQQIIQSVDIALGQPLICVDEEIVMELNGTVSYLLSCVAWPYYSSSTKNPRMQERWPPPLLNNTSHGHLASSHLPLVHTIPAEVYFQSEPLHFELLRAAPRSVRVRFCFFRVHVEHSLEGCCPCSYYPSTPFACEVPPHSEDKMSSTYYNSKQRGTGAAGAREGNLNNERNIPSIRGRNRFSTSAGEHELLLPLRVSITITEFDTSSDTQTFAHMRRADISLQLNDGVLSLHGKLDNPLFSYVHEEVVFWHRFLSACMRFLHLLRERLQLRGHMMGSYSSDGGDISSPIEVVDTGKDLLWWQRILILAAERKQRLSMGGQPYLYHQRYRFTNSSRNFTNSRSLAGGGAAGYGISARQRVAVQLEINSSPSNHIGVSSLSETLSDDGDLSNGCGTYGRQQYRDSVDSSHSSSGESSTEFQRRPSLSNQGGPIHCTSKDSQLIIGLRPSESVPGLELGVRFCTLMMEAELILPYAVGGETFLDHAKSWRLHPTNLHTEVNTMYCKLQQYPTSLRHYHDREHFWGTVLYCGNLFAWYHKRRLGCMLSYVQCEWSPELVNTLLAFDSIIPRKKKTPIKLDSARGSPQKMTYSHSVSGSSIASNVPCTSSAHSNISRDLDDIWWQRMDAEVKIEHINIFAISEKRVFLMNRTDSITIQHSSSMNSSSSGFLSDLPSTQSMGSGGASGLFHPIPGDPRYHFDSQNPSLVPPVVETRLIMHKTQFLYRSLDDKDSESQSDNLAELGHRVRHATKGYPVRTCSEIAEQIALWQQLNIHWNHCSRNMTLSSTEAIAMYWALDIHLCLREVLEHLFCLIRFYRRHYQETKHSTVSNNWQDALDTPSQGSSLLSGWIYQIHLNHPQHRILLNLDVLHQIELQLSEILYTYTPGSGTTNVAVNTPMAGPSEAEVENVETAGGSLWKGICGSVNVNFDSQRIFHFKDLTVKASRPSTQLRHNTRFKLDTIANRIWAITAEEVNATFPYKYDFYECLRSFLSIRKLLRQLHSSPSSQSGAAPTLPPDYLIIIKQFRFELQDDPFESKLGDIFSIMLDEYEQYEKRIISVRNQLETALANGYHVTDEERQRIFDSLQADCPKQYVQRIQRFYRTYNCQASTLFKWTISRLYIRSLADAGLQGQANIERHLRQIDPCSPYPSSNLEFETLWCRFLHLNCAHWKWNLRDYSVPLLDIQDLYLDGRLIVAEQKPDEFATREVMLYPGKPWPEFKVLRCMAPLKFYHDFNADIGDLSLCYGPNWEPYFAWLNTSLERINRPSADPSPPVAWWDKSRLKLHGNLYSVIQNMRWRYPTSLDPYNTTEFFDWQWNRVILHWTNMKWVIFGDLNIHCRTASKYDGDCRLLRLPNLELIILLQWICDGDPNDHHSIMPCAPEKVALKTASMELPIDEDYDTYKAFRSRHLDIAFTFHVRSMEDRSGTTPNGSRSMRNVPGELSDSGHANEPLCLFYTHIFKFFDKLKMCVSRVNRPIRRGPLWNLVRPKKPLLGRTVRNVSFHFKVPCIAVKYWVSISKRNGLLLLCEAPLSLEVSLLSNHIKSSEILPNTGITLKRRMRVDWSVVRMSAEASSLHAWLLCPKGASCESSANTSSMYAPFQCTPKHFSLTFGDEGIQRLEFFYVTTIAYQRVGFVDQGSSRMQRPPYRIKLKLASHGDSSTSVVDLPPSQPVPSVSNLIRKNSIAMGRRKSTTVGTITDDGLKEDISNVIATGQTTANSTLRRGKDNDPFLSHEELEPVHQLKVREFRFRWTQENRNQVYDMIDIYRHAQSLKRNLSAQTLRLSQFSSLSTVAGSKTNPVEGNSSSLAANNDGGGTQTRMSGGVSTFHPNSVHSLPSELECTNSSRIHSLSLSETAGHQPDTSENTDPCIFESLNKAKATVLSAPASHPRLSSLPKDNLDRKKKNSGSGQIYRSRHHPQQQPSQCIPRRHGHVERSENSSSDSENSLSEECEEGNEDEPLDATTEEMIQHLLQVPMLAQLREEADSKLYAFCDKDPKPLNVVDKLEGVSLCQSTDVKAKNWHIELVNSQVMLRISNSSSGYVIACAAFARIDSLEHSPVWRDSQLMSKSSLVGRLEGVQYYATQGLESQDRDTSDNMSPDYWLDSQYVEDCPIPAEDALTGLPEMVGSGRGLGGTVFACRTMHYNNRTPCSERLVYSQPSGGVPMTNLGTYATVGSNHSHDGRVGEELQRIVARCSCHLFYISYDSLDANTVSSEWIPPLPVDEEDLFKKPEGANTLTLLHGTLQVQTNSSQYHMLIDIVNDLLLYVEPQRQALVERKRMEMSYMDEMQLKSTILSTQASLRHMLQEQRDAERELSDVLHLVCTDQTLSLEPHQLTQDQLTLRDTILTKQRQLEADVLRIKEALHKQNMVLSQFIATYQQRSVQRACRRIVNDTNVNATNLTTSDNSVMNLPSSGPEKSSSMEYSTEKTSSNTQDKYPHAATSSNLSSKTSNLKSSSKRFLNSLTRTSATIDNNTSSFSPKQAASESGQPRSKSKTVSSDNSRTKSQSLDDGLCDVPSTEIVPGSLEERVKAGKAEMRKYEFCFEHAMWRLTSNDGQIGLSLVELRGFTYTKVNRVDDSGSHRLELGWLKVINPMANAFSTVVLEPNLRREEFSGGPVLQISCIEQYPVGGIPIKEVLEINVAPLVLQVSKAYKNAMINFFFSEKADTPQQQQPNQAGTAAKMASPPKESLPSKNVNLFHGTPFTSDVVGHMFSPSNTTDRGNCLQHSLTSEEYSQLLSSSRMKEEESRLFFESESGIDSTGWTNLTMAEALANADKPIVPSSSGGLGARCDENVMPNTSKAFSNLGGNHERTFAPQSNEDTFDTMRERARKNHVFYYVKISGFPLLFSYKGEKQKNIIDVANFALSVPSIDIHNVTYTWLDLFNEVKARVKRQLMKEVIKKKLTIRKFPFALRNRTPKDLEEDMESKKMRMLLGKTLHSREKPSRKGIGGVFHLKR